MLGPMQEAEGLAMLAETGGRIVAGVRRVVPEWAAARVGSLLDAWGQHSASERAALLAEARVAGRHAAERVARELEALLTLDPEQQSATPLQIVRTVYREVGDVLRAAGVAPVVRDEFAERAWPDDDYALVPDTLADFGDEELAPLHLAWGVAKATVVKARRS